MRNLKLISTLILLLPCSLHAQQTILDDQTVVPVENVQLDENQLDPAIHGEWSEPKNGIRMMVKFLQADEPNNEIHLLVFAENCSKKPINFPGFLPVSMLQMGDSYLGGGNLMVTAKPIGRKQFRKVESILDKAGGLEKSIEKIRPGEIRIHALRLKFGLNEMFAKKLVEQNPNAIQMDDVYSPSLPERRWRFSLSWRPDEQFPIPGQQEEREMVRVDEVWRNVQIDLPPFELDWHPPENHMDH